MVILKGSYPLLWYEGKTRIWPLLIDLYNNYLTGLLDCNKDHRASCLYVEDRRGTFSHHLQVKPILLQILHISKKVMRRQVDSKASCMF